MRYIPEIGTPSGYWVKTSETGSMEITPIILMAGVFFLVGTVHYLVEIIATLRGR